jgi:hypothetical protein
VVSDKDIDALVEPIHDALFGEHYTGQVALYNAIRAGVLQAYEQGKAAAHAPEDDNNG